MIEDIKTPYFAERELAQPVPSQASFTETPVSTEIRIVGKMSAARKLERDAEAMLACKPVLLVGYQVFHWWPCIEASILICCARSSP
jgi:hypothetical protein